MAMKKNIALTKILKEINKRLNPHFEGKNEDHIPDLKEMIGTHIEARIIYNMTKFGLEELERLDNRSEIK